jgi:glycosyltransferase involved in cell wall biosynthesis
MDGPDPDDARSWLREFESTHGRKLRVLHIGNIANNAYNNAKIQRRRGIEADVSCHDYYHVMGSPEWEDAEFIGDVVDEYCPDWWNVDLRGFRRPEWFAQGTFHTCAAYLLARHDDPGRARRLWRKLTRERWLRCRSTQPAAALRLVTGARARGRAVRLSFAWLLAWLLVPLRIAVRRAFATVHAFRALRAGASLSVVLLILLPVRLVPRAWRNTLVAQAEESSSEYVKKGEEPSRDDLPARFRAAFPDREDELIAADYYEQRRQVPFWRPLLEQYDIVQAYSTDGVVPLLAGTEAWAAYEHGTLREIPFEDTPRGRLCALTYREAPIVFVTNSDVLPSVERLGLDPERIVFLPHAVDTDRLFAFADKHAAEVVADDGVTLYSPSRQDWVDRDASWSKGNDVFLRAAALLVDRHPFRIVLAKWGRDLKATRALLDELRIADRVEWVPPLRKRELWLRYLRSHAVVDQFVLPAIGGVTFEAMALGRRVVTAMDAKHTARFFGRTPPLLGAQEVDEVAAALEEILVDPPDADGLGRSARAWVAEFHSADRIVDLQASAYRRLLERP